jgi:hypothetical protein
VGCIAQASYRFARRAKYCARVAICGAPFSHSWVKASDHALKDVVDGSEDVDGVGLLQAPDALATSNRARMTNERPISRARQQASDALHVRPTRGYSTSHGAGRPLAKPLHEVIRV